MLSRIAVIASLVSLGGLPNGCVENVAGPVGPAAPPPLSGPPVGLQVRALEPDLSGLSFRILLDFENPVDLAFITPLPAQLAPGAAHSGRSSIALVPPRRQLVVKLASLIGDSGFPGPWTLIGGYFQAMQPTTVTVTCRPAGQAPLSRSVRLAPGKWTAVLLDISQMAPAAVSALEFDVESAGPVMCDDILVINNLRNFYTHPADAADQGWTIRKRGFVLEAIRPGRFKLTLNSRDAMPDGWACDEANALRARFSSGSRRWVVYSDGRQIQDGRCSLLSNAGPASAVEQAVAQHENPAEIEIDAEVGRLNRETPGDAHNDGYNEALGAYQLVALTPRLAARIVPKKPLTRPVLEISGLPAGQPLITLEGQLVNRWARLNDGKMLVELPASISRPTSFTIAIK